jgi:predicted phosphodiesterase
MRIAVIADVHGNSWALEAVLESIARDRVDFTVDLGDTVYGPLDPAGTAKLLRSLDLPTVRGNQDRLLLDPDVPSNATTDFVMNELTEADLSWLRSLPFDRVVADTLLLFHGSPADDEQYFLETVAEGSVARRPDVEISNALEPCPTKYACCGHSHLPQLRVLREGRVVVNPGSVGLPAYSGSTPVPHKVESGTPHAKYAVVTLRNAVLHVDLRQVEYAWEIAARRASELDREDWAAAIRTGRVPS